MPVEIRQLNIRSTIASPCGSCSLDESGEQGGSSPDSGSETLDLCRSAIHETLRQSRER